MSRSMRKHAQTLIGQHVVVYHAHGFVYMGVLHSVTEQGIYLSDCEVISQVSGKATAADFEHAVSDVNQPNLEQVFFPFFFVPFAFLTGVAAANIARPPYYYGYPGYYGPGYGPYW